jgi:hypothetical protein
MKKKSDQKKEHKHLEKILKLTVNELREHAPFTVTGAFSAILILILIMFGGLLEQVHQLDETIFFILHPSHVFLSAWVTTSLYQKYGSKKLWMAIIIGLTGSLGIATLSDSLIPYLSEILFQLPNAQTHIGFIEEPVTTISPALLGIALGYFVSATKFPHLGHVLLSTWASLFHVIMALGATVLWWQVSGIFFFLFIAVWLPCCLSDIIYPLLFIKRVEDIDECEICAH